MFITEIMQVKEDEEERRHIVRPKVKAPIKKNI